MKTYCSLVLVGYLFIFAFAAHAVVINLSPKECDEAIKFGTAHRNSIEKDLDQRYSFGSVEEFADGGIIHTRWYKLALMSAHKAQKGQVIAAQDQSEILSDPRLQINVTVHGQSLDFARGYQVTLLQNGREIKPEKLHADHFMHHQPTKKTPDGFPCCWAIVRVYFKDDSIDPAGKTTLLLKKNGTVTRFDIDLKTFK